VRGGGSFGGARGWKVAPAAVSGLSVGTDGSSSDYYLTNKKRIVNGATEGRVCKAHGVPTFDQVLRCTEFCRSCAMYRALTKLWPSCGTAALTVSGRHWGVGSRVDTGSL